MKSTEYNGVIYRLGDSVRIEHSVPDFDPNGMGEGKAFGALWNDFMDNTIGRTGKITHIESGFVRVENRQERWVWNYPLAALRNLTARPISRYNLKPFQRAVTRNGWTWIVVSHNALYDAKVPEAPLFLIREDENYTHVAWPGECKVVELEIVEVYEAPPFVHDILNVKAKGELVWHEHLDAEREQRGQLIGRLLQQQEELQERIQQLQQEQSECKISN